MATARPTRFDFGFLATLTFWSTAALSLLIVAFYLCSRPEIHLLPALDLLEIIEAKTLDVRFRLRGLLEPKDQIVIIAIDERTEDAFGRWQSSGRQWLAKLIEILRAGNARVVGFDLVLAEPDEGRALTMLADIAAFYQQAAPAADPARPDLMRYLEQVRAAHDYDAQLAAAIQQSGNVVLGLYHYLDAIKAQHLTPEKHQAYQALIARTAYTAIQFPAGVTPQSLYVTRSFGVEPNLPMFSEAARSFGHYNVAADRDGHIRFTYLLLDYDGTCYPSLDLEIARAALNRSLPPIIHALGQEGGGSVAAIELGDSLIPATESGQLFINYYGPRETFPYYSLADVLQGVIPAYKFADKIVMVGFTSSIYQDTYATPFQPQDYPGVEIHATIIENILERDFLQKPEATIVIEAGLIVMLGLFLGIIRHQRSPLWGTFISLGSGLLIAAGATLAFIVGRIWINITFPLSFIVIDYIMITSYKYFTEERQKRGLKSAFQHYLAPTVVNQMLKNIETLKLGGERKQLTALFSDIRGFTSIAENMPPEQLVEFLNTYLSEMTEVILEHSGTVDKYIGDAIVAFYGAPLDQPDHAIRACKTTINMLIRLKKLQVEWDARGLPVMIIGIGINSGDMSVGNMGSRERFDYTIMGDQVNLASRLEGVNKEYGTHILISHFTYALLRQSPEAWTVREIDTVRVKGRREPVTLYELVGYDSFYGHKRALLDQFNAGLQAYKARQWAHALAAFQAALQIEPADQPSQIYVTRCTDYQAHPPADDWDGVHELLSK